MNLDELKKLGFLKQKQSDTLLLRVRTVGGNLTADKMAAVSKIANTYGSGQVHFTTRQGIEVHWIKPESVPAILEEMKEAGLLPGIAGPKVRNIVACPGEEVCRYGLMDSKKMSAALDEFFAGMEVPSKLKIAVSGCPNSCAKPQENDIGLMGAVEPRFKAVNCNGCGACAKKCPAAAIRILQGNARITKDKCINCGWCITACPKGAWLEGKKGFNLFIGGKVGRFPRQGTKLASLIPEEEVIAKIKEVIDLYQDVAQKGQRIADVMDKLMPPAAESVI